MVVAKDARLFLQGLLTFLFIPAALGHGRPGTQSQRRRHASEEEDKLGWGYGLGCIGGFWIKCGSRNSEEERGRGGKGEGGEEKGKGAKRMRRDGA